MDDICRSTGEVCFIYSVKLPMFKFLQNLVDDNRRHINGYKPLVTKINSLETEIKKLSDKKLAAKTTEFKEKINKGVKLNDLLPEAYAVVREAIFRTIGERAYDVQLMAAISLNQGAVAEQRTGEGKTHSVLFPAYLNALTGRGVHVITPNDYLTRVGAGWYPKALNFLGITTAAIVHEESFILDPEYTDPSEKIDDRLAHLRPISRAEAYQADVTYGTNNEFGFDYLRDHMVGDFSQKVQRSDHYFAVVDEVDFVLIDEARTPLIISSPNNQPVEKYYKFAQISAGLQPTDYVIDEKSKSATLSEFGIRKVEKVLGVSNLYEESFETIHYIENAIKARALFHKDKDYVVKDNEIIIVDEFTGRLMQGRRWSDGLHQAVEAKENVKVQQESQTWATITFQNYFRLYEKLSGMTGTAATESEEFKKIYNLDVITIPTHRDTKRTDDNDLIFKTQRSKYAAIAAKVEELHHLGQPVLIGTTSIAKNEVISSMLKNKGIPFQMLNAKNHQSEAEIIANAGMKGAVTVATNMAGRGVDIILGGPKDKFSPETWQKQHDDVISFGGLYVIGTERHESRRIDNQLRGRSGRQGDPGFSQFYVALDDDLMRIFGGEKISGLMTRFNMPDDAPLTHPLVSKVLEQIQVKVEGYNFDIRKSLVEYDDVINKQRQIIYRLRDDTLFNAKNDPQKNHDNIFKYLNSEINHLVAENQDFESGFKADKLALEFSEILPISSANRIQLIKDLKKSDNPQLLLTSLLDNQWKQRVDYFGNDLANNILAYAVIQTLDPLWVDHLTALDDLRDGVRLRGYAQKDPLIEYRKEGFDMFQALLRRFESNLARMLFRLEPVAAPVTAPAQATETRGKVVDPSQPVVTPGNEENEEKLELPTREPVISKALGRNDPCWCGSGKKFKKCHYPEIG
ncbi:MAG: Protein translocase subunit SecA [Candidatus Shapirobacteria bacterium GW2011_GWE1_38_10]|uniref:Protein translocase subunit SecA n=1 Tax=Candidatus Shapirobacteria bacterium GW2011_GWE1_38_10 TaxID=1618488 RepID=A0A0G0LA95_9BACT|nr:MAG: Protein translocase subunit SecA [Candidatus Shapirobacteria bacterium GW2011_GWF2_37_20]KKQ49581.1 MAG: Protein translocase subunit SecA [Candidatus Shapirobacteria bacterium GW2011_GWE1_38_10]